MTALTQAQGRKDSLVITGARVVDPVGVDAHVDVRVDDGVIAAIGTALERNAHRVEDAHGLVLAPAFVDPHVHLRTPGREDEETIASGTAAAAAGGGVLVVVGTVVAALAVPSFVRYRVTRPRA